MVLVVDMPREPLVNGRRAQLDHRALRNLEEPRVAGSDLVVAPRTFALIQKFLKNGTTDVFLK